MGFHFAHLLAYGESLRSPTKIQNSSAVVETVVIEMVHHSTTIINLAIETTDDRTRHLTDHIYHIVTFSALTLCRLVHTYEEKLTAVNHDVGELDNLVVKLIDWLRSIGLPCHAAHMLAGILAAQFNKLRPSYVRPEVTGELDFGTFSDQNLAGMDGLLNSDFIGWEFFNIAMDTAPWPQWESMYTNNGL
ncbi:hypothetical protein ZTR_09296 [Talaromyces verruculosus]|nr:hypothetical protein ZTR_09296 [Talaromyces verruculosus]